VFLIDVRSSSALALSLIYLGLRRVFGLVRSSRGTESDRQIEIMVLRHELRIFLFSSGTLTHVSGIGQQIERSSRRSAGCCLDHVGGPLWLPPTRCSDGTGKRPNAYGGDGEHAATLVDHR
jgi:hypothetical protein